MRRGIIDIYKMKFKKEIDAIVAVTNHGYCDHLDCSPVIDNLGFTISNYKPRGHPKIISYPCFPTEYYNQQSKDLQDLFIIFFNRKEQDMPIYFEKAKISPFFEEIEVTKKIIKPRKIHYTTSHAKRKYTRKLLSIAKKGEVVGKFYSEKIGD